MTMDDVPEFKPSNLDQRVERILAAKGRTHFSLADWDFQNADWTLDETIYHTAAPSLHGTGSGIALVKHATSGALSDGRLVTWVRSSGASTLCYFWFRNQRVDGGADYANCYYGLIYSNELRFYKFVATASTLIDTHAMTWTWSLNTWYKVRVTWWTSVDRIYVRMERWTGSEWVTFGGDADTDFEDTDDLWKDNAVNRVGVYYLADKWIDDVEVWG